MKPPKKVSRPYFGIEDMRSNDKFGRTLNNYSKMSPFNVAGKVSTLQQPPKGKK